MKLSILERAEIAWLAMHLAIDAEPVSIAADTPPPARDPGPAPEVTPASDTPPPAAVGLEQPGVTSSGSQLTDTAAPIRGRLGADRHDVDTLARDRVVSRFGRVDRVGPPELDLPASVKRSAELRAPCVVHRESEARITRVLLLVDSASTLEPWRREIDGLFKSLQGVGRLRQVHRRTVDLRAAPALDAPIPRADSGAFPSLALVVSDGLAPGFVKLPTLVAAAGYTRLAWVHPWDHPKWRRTPAGRTSRAAVRPLRPGETPTAALVSLAPARLATLARWQRGDARGLWGVEWPASETRRVGTPASRLSALSRVTDPAVVRLLGLTAAVAAKVDVELLTALGAGLVGEIAPVHVAEAMASGLLRRVPDTRPPLLEMDAETRTAVLGALPRAEVRRLWEFLLARFDKSPANRYGIDVGIIAGMLGHEGESGEPIRDITYAAAVCDVASLMGIAIPDAIAAAVAAATKPSLPSARRREPSRQARRLRVFLSSTYQDLVEHRKAASQAILSLGHELLSMELFAARPEPAMDSVRRHIADCDVLLCLVAHRFGAQPPGEGRSSYTQLETELASAAGKDVLVWIVDHRQPWPGIHMEALQHDLPLPDGPRVGRVTEAYSRLEDFKDWLRQTFVCDTFTTPEDLARKITVALDALSRREPSPARPASRPGEIRIVHPLQPAAHLRGREAIVLELNAWLADRNSRNRVQALVAPGGTGKTAVVATVVDAMIHEPGSERELKPHGHVLVWSFYENPDVDAFLRECTNLFVGEQKEQPDGPGQRLQGLLHGVSDGRPHLLVLDGLERIQNEGAEGIRGTLGNRSLAALLRYVAGGLGRARALITSRFRLADLADWKGRGYLENLLGDLDPTAAVDLLRGMGVVGDERDLRAAATQVGHHALSLVALGSYLRSSWDGRIEGTRDFVLESLTGTNPNAAALQRLLNAYADQLPTDEWRLLELLSAFPQGATLETLAGLVDAGGDIAGPLTGARSRLPDLLDSAVTHGLAIRLEVGDEAAWQVHSSVRDRFRASLDVSLKHYRDGVAALGETKVGDEHLPTSSQRLDHYERLIEATRLAGRVDEAFEIYRTSLGGYQHLGLTLGDHARGYRILEALRRSQGFDDLDAATPKWVRRVSLVSDLSLYAVALGRLTEALALQLIARQHAPTESELARAQVNAGELAFALGRLSDARSLAYGAATVAAMARGEHTTHVHARVLRGLTAHALGHVAEAEADFADAVRLNGRPLESVHAVQVARHHLDLGRFEAARELCRHALQEARWHGWNAGLPRLHAILARIDLEQQRDPAAHYHEMRELTGRTGIVADRIETLLISARWQFGGGFLREAAIEGVAGLELAMACGYALLQVELLIALARIRLAESDSARAIEAGQKALDLAAQPNTEYAWGIADAAQVVGEARLAAKEIGPAKSAFMRALDMRKHLGHPRTAETEAWLVRVG